jgi:hypothetical protein
MASCVGALMVLYRPVREREYTLIEASGFRRFPARLPEQPIFYPVVNEEYARQIARDWNTKDGGTGYVMRFSVRPEALSKYSIQTAGSRLHREYWIPAEALEEFNDQIVGKIEGIARFRG